MYYNSRDIRCKQPFGAVAAGNSVSFSIGLADEPVYLLFKKDGDDEFTRVAMQNVKNSHTVELPFNEPGLYFYCFESAGQYIVLSHGGEGTYSTLPEPCFQLTVYDSFETPDRFKGGVMYQIFPDSFNKSGKPKTGVPADRAFAPLDEIPEYLPDQNGRYSNRYYGGDLAGITEKLPYLSSLGVTILYLNPIFEAHSNHRYNTADYMKIDPLLGSLADFKRLCSEAAKRGISVILDGVFSHTGDDSVYFDRYGRYGGNGAFHNKSSRFYKWYKFSGGKYDAWWDIPTLPEVNELDPGFTEFICGKGGVIDYWLSNGASGFRLDVADELPDAFIADIRTSVKRHDGCLLIGEVWEDASNKISYGERRTYLHGHELDSVMNYPFKKAIIDFLKTADAAAFAESIMTVVENYPKPTLDVLMNLLSTHDTPRIINALAANEPALKADKRNYLMPRNEFLRGVELLKQAFLLAFTLPGFPSIYYGDEIAMQGFGDPFCRAYYRWGDPPADLSGLISELSALRRSSEAFKDGSCTFLRAEKGAVVFVREKGAHTALIALNRGDSPFSFTFRNVSYTVAPWRWITKVF